MPQAQTSHVLPSMGYLFPVPWPLHNHQMLTPKVAHTRCTHPISLGYRANYYFPMPNTWLTSYVSYPVPCDISGIGHSNLRVHVTCDHAASLWYISSTKDVKVGLRNLPALQTSLSLPHYSATTIFEHNNYAHCGQAMPYHLILVEYCSCAPAQSLYTTL